MKKRLVGLLLCFMMFGISVLTGCSLITLNRASYLNQTVATIENKANKNTITVTKKDLISAYNSYGYYYTQYYGYTAKAALDATLEMLINRKITIAAAEEVYKNGLSKEEKTYLWQKTSEALEDNYKSYLNDVLGITDTSSNNSSDARVFNNYKPNATLKNPNGEFIIEKNTTAKTIMEDFKKTYKESDVRDIKNADDKKEIYTNLLSLVSAVKAEAHTKAFNNYLKDLKNNEDGLRLSTDTMSIFLREIDRLYTVNYENYMITKYDEYFTNYSPYSNITVDQMLQLYAGMVRASYSQYVIEEDSSYESNMQSDSTGLYYYKEGANDTQFFQVAHVLFKFTDDQAKDYKQIQANRKNGVYTSDDEYEIAMADLLSELTPVVREAKYNEKTQKTEYVETDKRVKVEEGAESLASYIKTQVDLKSSTREKIDLFREFIYKYNDDPGMINASNNYTIGVNETESADGQDYGVDYKVYSNYVTEFTKAALALYDEGNGEIGSVSEPVITENGMHVLFYVGKVQNLFEGVNENFTLANDEVDPFTGLTPIEKLNSTKINPFVDKSYFDLIYDTLVTDNFSTFQNLNMTTLREKYDLKTYPDAYKDLANN